MPVFYVEGPVQARGTAPPLETGRPSAWEHVGDLVYRMPQPGRLVVSDQVDTNALPPQPVGRFSLALENQTSRRRAPKGYMEAARPFSFGDPLRPTMEKSGLFDSIHRGGRIVEVRR